MNNTRDSINQMSIQLHLPILKMLKESTKQKILQAIHSLIDDIETKDKWELFNYFMEVYEAENINEQMENEIKVRSEILIQRLEQIDEEEERRLQKEEREEKEVRLKKIQVDYPYQMMQQSDFRIDPSPPQFEQLWGIFETGSAGTWMIDPIKVAAINERNLQIFLKSKNIFCIATLDNANLIKFYCYCHLKVNSANIKIALMLILLQKSDCIMKIDVKCQQSELANNVFNKIKKQLHQGFVI